MRSNQKCSCRNGNHDAKTCRFKTEKCHKCNKVGHNSRACWGTSGGRFNTRPSTHGNSRGGSTGRSNSQGWGHSGKANYVDNQEECDMDEESLYTVYSTVDASIPMKVNVMVNKQQIPFVVDTGANVSIIPESITRRSSQ